MTDASSNRVDRTDRPFGDIDQQTGHPVFAHGNEDAIPNRVSEEPAGALQRVAPGAVTPAGQDATRNRVRELLDQHFAIYGCEKAHWILDPEARDKQFPELEEALRDLD